MKENIKTSQVKILCIKCQKEFLVYFYRRNQAKFCSKKCIKIIKNKICKICKREFNPRWPGKAIYCSQNCFGISQKKRKPWNLGIKACEDKRIKKFVEAGHKSTQGKIPWNKGLNWGNSNWLRKENPNKYRNIHKKIYKNYGAPNKCERCKKIGNNRNIHWANKNGHYLEIRTDWMRLCVSCHMKYDKSNKKKKELL